MDKAENELNETDKILEIISEIMINDWIDNQLNRQIWHIKRGSWEKALDIGLSLKEVIKDPYLKAKHAHMLGISYLYLGEIELAEKYARECEDLSDLVSLSSWIIGKAWRNRFADALLSTIDLVKGSRENKDPEKRKKYFENSQKTAKSTIRQLNPLFRWLLGSTIENHALYTEAFIDAINKNYKDAERKYSQLQQDKHLEAYYRIASQLDLAAIYLETDRQEEAIRLYKYCEKKASEFGFKYLEIRAIKKIHEHIDSDDSLIARITKLEEETINSNFMDTLKFLIPV